MKPVKLKFKGINSFSEETEIDFDKLIRGGIFGIFGDTGSGKSTILDCINFALYGRVERSKEKLDIINYRCDSAEVKFEFDVLTDGKRKNYSAERSLRKKSGIHKAMLYENGECVADSPKSVTEKIESVLGVNAEDFRKCIALPQGEFSQFVKSQPSERIKLIERLFSLSKYGETLRNKIKAREASVELEYQKINATIDTYSDVSADSLKELEKDIKNSVKNLERLKSENQSAEKKYSEIKKLSEKYSELKTAVEKFEELQAEKPKIEKFKSVQKALPFCNTAIEADIELCEKNKKIAEAENEIVKIDREILRQSEEHEKLKSRLEDEKLEDEISICKELKAKYSTCNGKPEKLSKLSEELKIRRDEFKNKEKELSKYIDCVKLAEKNVADTNKLLEDYVGKDLQHLINVDFKGALLKDEYVSTLDYFAGLNGQVKFYNDGSELYGFISKELKSQIEIYKDRVYQVKDFNLVDAQKKLESIQSADREREKLNKLLNDKKLELTQAQSKVETCQIELRHIREDGETLRKQSDEIKSELEKIFGGSGGDYASVIENNSERLKNLENLQKQLNDGLESLNKSINRLKVDNASKCAELKALKTQADELNKKSKTAIMQSGCDSVVECRKLIKEYSEYADAESSIEKFEKELIACDTKIKELESVKGIKEFNYLLLDEAEEFKNKIFSELTRANSDLAVKSAAREKSAERLEQKKQLEIQLAGTVKERNLIAQLKELTKGNKFMEYIANEYLCDISKLASSTLLNLTDGRYFLTYTDTFNAGDNFNCGNLRGVNTLSGGEIFLVSLSLALALSQTICASMKSIEFFFLDEGFGTLDSTLVDTVMNALEKLKSSRFTIGVISHVEELKHRIDNKITVKKATESHGSTVEISC